MKLLILITALMLFTRGNSFAFTGEVKDTTIEKSIDKAVAPPLYILRVNYEYEYEVTPDSTDSNFNPLSVVEQEWIKSITICKNNEVFKKYGKKAQNGVVIVEVHRKYLKLLPDIYKDKMQLASNN